MELCGVKLKDRLPRKELRERLGVDDIALVLQQNRLRWYGHVLVMMMMDELTLTWHIVLRLQGHVTVKKE